MLAFAAIPASFEFDGVVRLTRLGVGYLVFTLLIGFAAMNTGNNALYIVLALMLGALIVSGIASKDGLKRIDIELKELDEAWAGEPAWGTIRVRNRSRLWNVRDLLITSRDLEQPVHVPLLERRKEIEVEGELVFRRRGRAHFSSADLYTRYPFGIFLKKRRVALAGEAVVFPRRLEVSREPRRLGSLEGDIPRTSRPGAGSEIFAFREYAPGDPLRLVHWKKSASLGRWIMKQQELETGRLVRIALDPVVPPSVADDEFEQMVSEAATFLHHALVRGLEVILQIPPSIFRTHDGSGRQQMLEALALVELQRDAAPQTPFEPGTFVFSLRRDHESRSA
ncbi:MAG TPA: DUF58 domain-containing protein [Thermoanaerobaculia bacterium]|nr:DUF58 domain-containing protein [Thermoanaerobaculia bacterium]